MRKKVLRKPFLLMLSLLIASAAASEELRPMKELFDMATSGEPKFEELRKQAREEMVKRKGEALPYLFSRLGTRDAQERHAIKDIFLQIGEEGISYLIQGLKLPDWRAVLESAWIFEEMKEKRGAQPLTSVLTHENWRVRHAAISALGEIGDSSFAEAVLPFLSDRNELVRKAGAYALGQLKWSSKPEVLITLLGDNFYGVRYGASFALAKGGEEETRKLIGSYRKRTDKISRYHLIETIGEARIDDAFAFVISLSTDPDPFVKAFVARALLQYGDKPEAISILKRLALESDLIVRAEAVSSLEAIEKKN